MSEQQPVSPEVERKILEAALRAPSAHNAQPWRLTRSGDRRYLMWYAYEDKLLADPDDRDGIMAIGGFYETLRLAAESHGVGAPFRYCIRQHHLGIDLAEVSLEALVDPPDPLAASVGKRQSNRHSYDAKPLPEELAEDLRKLGNILLDPPAIAELVDRASVMAWKDSRFVTDLDKWTRFDQVSPDGMTVDCLDLSRLDQMALRFALRRGKLPGWLARVYAQRDVRLTRASAAIAVLITPDRRPETLFECGRRLLRSWATINAVGYAWHPMSIVIDQPTVQELFRLIGGRDGVAIYRVGYTSRSAPWSKRRSLESVIATRAGSLAP
ncbi:MAG TPA: nitroreductase family protein [Steroidobacteraceae bacterium]|jgi:nitroreductase|nr:nitroreductase family protein [Steroidobacteraceae bacterium]